MRASKTDVVDRSPSFSRRKLHSSAPLFQRLAFLIAALILPLSTFADSPPANDKIQIALQDSTKADLLLFWEEKDLYVASATRVEKPLTQAAENITVITAREIEAMNAHSVAEVLNRAAGVFVQFQGQDFVSPSLISIQGSEPRHVTVLLDGVVWNSLSEGSAETLDIPVRIVDRIEIVKGPASSAWGSSLGGVINIITRETGETVIPRGAASASYGEANSQEYTGELYGNAGPVGYYLYAGRQKSDGLRDHREYERNSFYGKVSVNPNDDLDLLFTVGYSDPFVSQGDNPNLLGPMGPTDSRTDLSTLFVTGALDFRLPRGLGLKGGVRYLQKGFDQPVSDRDTGQLLRGTNIDEETVSGEFRLTYQDSINNAVLGSEISHGTMDYTTSYGTIFQLFFGKPPREKTSPTLDRWAVFANDTIEIGGFSVTPGIRYDHNNVSGSFLSPSIGATYRAAEHTTLRASISRGFTYPPLAYTSAGGFFTVPNRALRAEHGWSYQAGGEIGIADLVNLKATLFRHETRDAIVEARSTSDPNNRIYRNGGAVTRQGYEVEAETVPLWNLSLRAGHAYVRKYADDESDWKRNYSVLLGLRYDDRRSFRAELTAYYLWWDQPSFYGARYDDFIWDLSLNKRFFTVGTTTTELFLSLRNLFNGAYYTVNALPNGGRWVEGGIRFSF